MALRNVFLEKNKKVVLLYKILLKCHHLSFGFQLKYYSDSSVLLRKAKNFGFYGSCELRKWKMYSLGSPYDYWKFGSKAVGYFLIAWMRISYQIPSQDFRNVFDETIFIFWNIKFTRVLWPKLFSFCIKYFCQFKVYKFSTLRIIKSYLFIKQLFMLKIFVYLLKHIYQYNVVYL